jgi:hypothetical protein
MGMSVHRNSVHGYQQIDGIEVLINRMGPAPVMVQCSNDEIVPKKASGDCDVSGKKSLVQAHDFEFPNFIAVSRFERKRRRPDLVDIPELLGMSL